MNGVGTFIANAFNAIPLWLRKFVGMGVAAGVALTMVLIAFLAFPFLRDYAKEKLGIPTEADFQNVSDAVQVASEDQVLAVAHLVAAEAIAHYDDSLKQAYETGMNEMGIPIMELQRDMITRIRELERLQGITVRSIQALPKQDNEAVERMSATVDDLRRELHEAQIRENMKALQIQLDSIQEHQRKPARTSRVKM